MSPTGVRLLAVVYLVMEIALIWAVNVWLDPLGILHFTGGEVVAAVLIFGSFALIVRRSYRQRPKALAVTPGAFMVGPSVVHQALLSLIFGLVAGAFTEPFQPVLLAAALIPPATVLVLRRPPSHSRHKVLCCTAL